MPPGESYPSTESSAKRDLASWWKNFKKGNHKRDEERNIAEPEIQPYGIFGVPLQTSVRYANVAISLNDANGQSYIYGYVPIIVAKCGVFLKEKATDVEGIFRLSGSEKRIKELKLTFNSPDRYGKGLNWTGYTVHDAANILRRYFNQLPEPIIPLDFYDQFRDPLKDPQSQAVGSMDGQNPSVGTFDVGRVIKTYQDLITHLPPLNRQLLLYILDLLAVFASKSDLNKMTTPNLAAIFQPGILSHPAHDMAPEQYKLSQDVLIFMIENQDHFLIGMQGTAADEKTVQEVESGPPTPQHRSSTPKHSKNTLGRSGSNSSRYSGVRRSASASSRRSKNSATAQTSQSPVGSDFQNPLSSPTVTGGVHRSNTLPHTRSPSLTPGRFIRDPESNPVTPILIEESSDAPKTQAQTAPLSQTTSPPEKKMHSQTIMQEMMSPTETANMPVLPSALPPTDPRDKGLKTPTQTTFDQSQAQSQSQTNQTGTAKIVASLLGKPADGKKPAKLQKKRPGGSSNPSAHSSTHSLNDHVEPATYDSLIMPRKENVSGPMWNDNGPLQSPPPIGGGHLHPNMSPAASYASQSDREMADPDALNLQGDEDPPDAKKKRQWFQRDRKAEGPAQPNTIVLGSNGLAQTSRSSVLSGDGSQRKSVTLDRSQQGDGPLSDSERESRKEKNPISWIKNKVRDLQDKIDERKEEKRMTSPNRASQSYSTNPLPTSSIDTITTGRKSSDQLAPPSGRTSLSNEESRGKSTEIPRIQEPIPEQPLQEQQAEQKVDSKMESVPPPQSTTQSTQHSEPIIPEAPATDVNSKS